MKRKKTIKKWANHIIKRFGKLNALNFACQLYDNCPCFFLDRECEVCEYSPKIDKKLILCDAAKDFVLETDKDYIFIYKLKEKIKGMINNGKTNL